MTRPVPAGFGVPFWRSQIFAAESACSTFDEQSACVDRVLEELIAQTRLDEAMRCAFGGTDVAARIAEHRKDLRRAQRRARSK